MAVLMARRDGGKAIDYYKADVVSASDYYPFGMQMPGRSVSKGDYRFGFNGKMKDDEIGAGFQDYGFREYNYVIARFISVDPLTKKYPELTPYQFASNSPISGIDLDGLEYYYAANGSLKWKYGTSTEVMLVNDEFVKKYEGKKVAIKELSTASTAVGMTNEELNTRAFMSTLKQTENGGNEALPYNATHGYTDGQPNTFTDGDYKNSPNDYADHPYFSENGESLPDGGTASGAFQILKGSWKNPNDPVVSKIREKYNITDFSPENQDKMVLGIIDIKRSSLSLIKQGNITKAVENLRKEWSSLPGASQSHGMTMARFNTLFRKNVSNELQNKTNLSIKKGELFKKR